VARPTLRVVQHSPLSSKPHQYPRLPPSRRALGVSRGQRVGLLKWTFLLFRTTT